LHSLIASVTYLLPVQKYCREGNGGLWKKCGL